MRIAPFVVVLAAVLYDLVAVPVVVASESRDAGFFEERIRPLLVENCQPCHGPKKHEAGLRLDTREGLLRGSESGPVVVPGKPGESALIEAIGHSGAVKMPPKKKLAPEAIANLTRWVEEGANWPTQGTHPSAAGASLEIAAEARRHWAFQTVKEPLIPSVGDRSWPGNSVDAFVLARLEAKGLSPSPRANRRTLIRRAAFDLLGMPPSLEEVAAFEADPGTEAYARLIERLLASPHYGERWARHWLDVARYSDTRGYVFFQDANFHWAYTYRDYVIRALNSDVPYDRFIVEQLAADRLRIGDDRRSLTALGYVTLGGRFMNNFHDVIDDRIDVVCRGLMGLTVTCARCHDHKYDPISSADYYALYGIFASAEEPTIPPEFSPPPKTVEYARFAAELKGREAKLSGFVAAKHRELVDASRTRAAEYLLAATQALDQPNTEEFMLIADGNDLNPKMLLRWQTYLARTRKAHDPVFAPWHALASLPKDDFANQTARLCADLVGTHDTTRPINPVVARALSRKPPRTLADAARVYGKLLNEVESIWREAARRASLNGTEPGPLPDADLELLRSVFHGPDAPPDVPMAPFGDLALLPDRPSQARMQELRTAVQDWLVKGPGAPARAMVLADLATPVEPRLFLRGNPNNPGEAVPRRLPGILAGIHPGPFRDGGRLDLARAIVDPKNPLTARVLVNRVWLHHLGSPLVSTPSDFGLRSDPPTNPELLDFLASSFMKGGWSLKSLHRMIMLSSTYQQASDDLPRGATIDPENTLYWRMNRRRLDFESTRDALLAVSGRIDRVLGGPSFAGLTDPLSRRRTLYATIDRLNLPGLYRTFDFPDPNATSPRRDQTTVPPQSLFMMNHPFVRAMAEAMLNRAEVAACKNSGARIESLYRLAYGRVPRDEEASLARAFLAQTPAPWADFAQALLMANEFVFVD